MWENESGSKTQTWTPWGERERGCETSWASELFSSTESTKFMEQPQSTIVR